MAEDQGRTVAQVSCSQILFPRRRRRQKKEEQKERKEKEESRTWFRDYPFATQTPITDAFSAGTVCHVVSQARDVKYTAFDLHLRVSKGKYILQLPKEAKAKKQLIIIMVQP